jgi:hypothetical protein
MLNKKIKIPILLICLFSTLMFIFYGKISTNFKKLDKEFFRQVSINNGNAFINLNIRVKTISFFVRNKHLTDYKLHKSLEKNPNISQRVTEILWPTRRKDNSKNLFIISDQIKNNKIICSKIIILKNQISYCKLK